MNIKNEIREFINADENNGALLITGSWGCGKSYLVKSLVNDFNQGNEFAIAIISLFGIDSISMLHERIKDAYLEFISGLFGKTARKVFGTLKKLTNESAKVTAAAMPTSVTASAISTGISSVISFDALKFVTVKNTVGLGEKLRKFAIVFDDFERCGIENKPAMFAGVKNNAENIKNRVIATQYSATNMAQRTPHSPRYDDSITDTEPVVNTENKGAFLCYGEAIFHSPKANFVEKSSKKVCKCR